MKNILYILFFITIGVQAQQDPQYTQYMYNMNVINPAYAGSSESVSIGALYRSQWVGLEGAPSTATLAIHSPVGNRVGLGFSLISDEVGPVSETNTYIDFSYTLPVVNNTKLALGLKAGATFHDIGLATVETIDQNDPFFSQDANTTTPNIGAGLYLYEPSKWYVSASMPNILNGTHLDLDGRKIGSEREHIFAAAGYVFNLSENFKLKPHALMKFAFDAPVSYDVNLNLFMYDKVEIGAGYRVDDSFSGMVNFLISPALRIGYAYDAIQSELNVVTDASHEIFVNFDINIPATVSRSPRYF